MAKDEWKLDSIHQNRRFVGRFFVVGASLFWRMHHLQYRKPHYTASGFGSGKSLFPCPTPATTSSGISQPFIYRLIDVDEERK